MKSPTKAVAMIAVTAEGTMCQPAAALSPQVMKAETPSISAWAMLRKPSTWRVSEKPIVARIRKQPVTTPVRAYCASKVKRLLPLRPAALRPVNSLWPGIRSAQVRAALP
ncbi:MAG: hypothetical protein V9G18_16100 [Albidovulum sp.]